MPFHYEEIRGRLTEDLYGCDSAAAVSIRVDGQGNETDDDPFTVYDPLNLVAACLIALTDAGGELYLPAGTCFYAHRFQDSDNWELHEIGGCCVQGSGSGGSEGSEGSEGSSEGSRGAAAAKDQVPLVRAVPAPAASPRRCCSPA